MEPAAVTNEEQSDLCGTWTSVPGTMEGFDDFLMVSGANWVLRKAAAKMVESAKFKIEISNIGDKFLIVNTGPKGAETKEFVVGGPSFQSKFGPEKTPGTGKAVWDGGVLVLTAEMPGQTVVVRRELEGGFLKESTTLRKDGKSALLKRTYERTA